MPVHWIKTNDISHQIDKLHFKQGRDLLKGIRNRAVQALICISLFIMINGCTVIGFGIGSFIDSRKPDIRFDPACDLEKLELRQRITVVLKEGGRIKGEFAGIGTIDNEDLYAARYADMMKRITSRPELPEIDDTITVYMKPAKNKVYMERIFQGFALSSNPGGRKIYLKYGYRRSKALETVNLDLVHAIADASGQRYSIDEMEDFITAGGLNDLTVLVLKNRANIQKIELNSIDTITKRPEGKMAKILGIAGLVTDLVIYAIMRPTSEKGSSSGGGG